MAKITKYQGFKIFKVLTHSDGVDLFETHLVYARKRHIVSHIFPVVVCERDSGIYWPVVLKKEQHTSIQFGIIIWEKDFYIVETIGSPGSVVEILVEVFWIIVSIDF